MKRKQIGKKIAKTVTAVTLAAILALNITPGIAKADTTSQIQQSIADKQAQIKAAQDEKNAIKANITNIQNVKKQLEKSKNDLSAFVTQLDNNVSDIEDKISQLNDDIDKKTKEIDQSRKELEEAEQVKADQYAAMKKRVKALYEQGDDYYLELLITAHGFGDFLNNMENINKLADYDSRMYAQYQQTVDYCEACKAKLEAEEEVLEETKQAAEDEKKAVEELIAEKEKEITAYENDINNKEAAIKAYEQELAVTSSVISELEKAVAAERAKLNTNRTYDGGMFCWPAPSFTRVSSEYGYRVHPILGVQKFHNGVDLAAPGGSDILAAYDGTVVAAAYNDTMGNYVMIDHGGELYTIYMHASKLLCSAGQNVSRGQRIALVGTTGRSTGNHLHFTVRLNGQYVSPWNYIPHP